MLQPQQEIYMANKMVAGQQRNMDRTIEVTLCVHGLAQLCHEQAPVSHGVTTAAEVLLFTQSCTSNPAVY